jgi:hypothetical protein
LRNNTNLKYGFGLIGLLLSVGIIVLLVGSFYFGLANFEGLGPFTATSTSIVDVGMNAEKMAQDLKAKLEGNQSYTDTRDWQMHTNQRFGLSFKFPGTMTVRDTPERILLAQLELSDIQASITITKGYQNYKWTDSIVPEITFQFNTQAGQYEYLNAYSNGNALFGATGQGNSIFHLSSGDVGNVSHAFVIPVQAKDVVAVVTFDAGGKHTDARYPALESQFESDLETLVKTIAL